MTYNEKSLIRSAVAVPVIVAVLLSAVFCTVITMVDLPFTQRNVCLADYQKEDINNPSEFTGNSGETVSKREIVSCITQNTIIGDILIENTNYPVIYNANEVNASGKFNITNDVLIGETGVCFAEIYKNDSSALKLLAKGDIVSVNTFYSVYEFEVVETAVASNPSQLAHCGEGVGSALVLYTDNSVGAGISDEYFVCICKMTSGSRVTEG